MAELRIGVSGWNYKHWRGDFYPDKLPQRRELEYVTRVFNTAELNGTFYSLKTPQSFDKWYDAAPNDFVYAVKGSRYITHTKRLRDAEPAAANFFASGVLRLGSKLGPFLWQLPPQMVIAPEMFDEFCGTLPKDTREAVELARQHTEKVSGRTWYDVQEHRNLRHAFEVRDPRLMNEQFIGILRRHGHALVFADTAGNYPFAEDITADFLYIRLHGSRELYASGYEDQELEWWKRRIRRWAKGEQMKTGKRVSDAEPPKRKLRDVYVYFDNDALGHAPYDALNLAQKLHASRDIHHLVGTDDQQLMPPPRLQEA